MTSESQSKMPDELSRYARQIQFAGFGVEGQRALLNSRVVIVGCGALGSVQATTLVRAGVGHVKIIDRDFLEMNNLQRQVLYDENDVASGLPKAIAAGNKLKKINSEIEIECVVEDVNYLNIQSHCEDATVILDGTDNFETRFLINDFSVANKIPWVYGGCIGTDGQSMTILPGNTPCLHCLMQEGPPAAGTTATCDSAGILSPIINVIASIQCAEAIKIMTENFKSVNHKLLSIGLWDNAWRQLDISKLREQVDCLCCDKGLFSWLNGDKASKSAVLCGRNAVQLSSPLSESDSNTSSLDFDALEKRFSELGQIQRNKFLIRLIHGGYVVTVFKDGRVIIKGTEDIAKAKSLYSQWIGN